MKKMTLCVAAMLACTGTTAGLAASSPADVRTMTVSYSDLDVNNPDGAAVLLARLEMASAQVCGPAPDIRDLGAHQRFASCYKTAMDRSVNSVASTLVRRIYAGLPEAVASK